MNEQVQNLMQSEDIKANSAANDASYTGHEINIIRVNNNELIQNEPMAPISKFEIDEEIQVIEPLGLSNNKQQLSLQEILEKNLENSIIEAHKNSNEIVNNQLVLDKNDDINSKGVKSSKSLQSLAQALLKDKQAPNSLKPSSILKRTATSKDTLISK